MIRKNTKEILNGLRKDSWVISNIWQVCPACNGKGWYDVEYDSQGKILNGKKCTVCNGKKIISTVTGLPPEDKK